MQQRLDTVSHHETPENVMLALHLAGSLVRSLVWLVDFGLRADAQIAPSNRLLSPTNPVT